MTHLPEHKPFPQVASPVKQSSESFVCILDHLELFTNRVDGRSLQGATIISEELQERGKFDLPFSVRRKQATVSCRCSITSSSREGRMSH